MVNDEFCFDTRAIHVGEKPDFSEGSKFDVVTPIHLSSTYARKEVRNPGYFQYSRCDNPTRTALEERYASLEGAKYGLAFASGLAAETTLLLSLLKSGDHVLGFDDLYGGTKRLFSQVFKGFGITADYADATDLDKFEAAIKSNTRLIWLESPTNPLIKLCDIQAISELAKSLGIITVVDNTFLTPFFQRPLSHGADIVVHSITKYIAGHSDVIGGAIMVSDEELHQKLKFNQNAVGAVPSPFDCYLTLRGLKTLPVRMRQHEANALGVVEYLEQHPKVERVYYPGLASHPQYTLGKKQASGAGGMLSFEIKGGEEAAIRLLENLELFTLAESLGGVESLIEHPGLMTHSSMTAEERAFAGISDSLIRVSVGIENLEDILNDLEQGFEKV